MSDLFAPLREPGTPPPLPPAEVRRAGERWRRRRTRSAVAAGVGATLVVVGAAALLLDRGGRSDSAPDPVETPQVHVIPEELDLADGLPRSSLMPGAQASPDLCGGAFSLAARSDATATAGYQDGGDLVARGIGVYPDEETAREATTTLVAVLGDCSQGAPGLGERWTTDVRATSTGDEGWVVTRYPRAGGDHRQPVEVAQVVRVGTDLLVVQQREIHGVTVDSMIRGTENQVDWLLDRQLCLLTDEGCAWRSDPDVLGPLGWGPWRLGTSLEDVTASGAPRGAEACEPVVLDEGVGRLAPSGELVGITVPAGVTTPDGIGVGATRDEVEARYWFAERAGGVLTARASPTTDYRFTVERGRVTALALVTVDPGCDP